MTLKVIAYARNGHTDKFGIPRQSKEDSPIITRIVFEPEYSVQEALRGIDGYSHLWLIWGFSSNDHIASYKHNGSTMEAQWKDNGRTTTLGAKKKFGRLKKKAYFCIFISDCQKAKK